MHKIIRFLVASFLVIAFTSTYIPAQVPTSDNELELHIKNIEKQADSLRSEARRLQDSLLGKIRNKDFGHLFFNADSLLGSGIIHGEGFLKDFHFEMPNIPEYKSYDGKTNPFITPKQEKKKSPVPGFKGWYMQGLAELED